MHPDPLVGGPVIAPEHADAHHVARNADQANHVEVRFEAYGFLASIEGEADGPWTLDFECIAAQWCHETLQALGHDLERLRILLGGATYADAWDHFGPAQRVALKSIRSHYNRRFDAAPPDNYLFDVVLDADDWVRRLGIQDRPVSGGWYHLSFSPPHGPAARQTANLLRHTGGATEAEDLGLYTLSSVRQLPTYFVEQGELVAEPILHALNSGEDEG